MSYPDFCLRGIKSEQDIDSEGNPMPGIFQFEDNDEREDDLHEMSINWEDNDSVIDFTLEQRRRDGEKKYKAGLVKIEREWIHKLNSRTIIGGRLSYERRPLSDNEYHGNILIDEISKRSKRTISAAISTAITGPVIPQTST